jgi:hypothetical protein
VVPCEAATDLAKGRAWPDTEGAGGSTPPAPTTPAVSRAFADRPIPLMDGSRRSQILTTAAPSWASETVTSPLDFDDLAICLAAADDVIAAEDLGADNRGALLECLRSEILSADDDLLTRSGATHGF